MVEMKHVSKYSYNKDEPYDKDLSKENCVRQLKEKLKIRGGI
jgi:hypothetical protein